MKTGYSFNGWDNKPDRMPAKDVTVTAQWTINNYTITFVFNNGTENEVRVLNYNETIAYPEDPTKDGYTFNGWSPKPVRMPAKDVTVTAQWIEKPTEFVEIVFGKKDLKEEEVREIIKEYTNEEFIIERFETGKETGEIRVIIKFNDKEKANEFVENMSKSKNSNDNIKSIKFSFEKGKSFSRVFLPIAFFILFIA